LKHGLGRPLFINLKIPGESLPTSRTSQLVFGEIRLVWFGSQGREKNPAKILTGDHEGNYLAWDSQNEVRSFFFQPDKRSTLDECSIRLIFSKVSITVISPLEQRADFYEFADERRINARCTPGMYSVVSTRATPRIASAVAQCDTRVPRRGEGGRSRQFIGGNGSSTGAVVCCDSSLLQLAIPNRRMRCVCLVCVCVWWRERERKREIVCMGERLCVRGRGCIV